MRRSLDVTMERMLRCPHCGAPMRADAAGSGSLVCEGERRHNFDFSASGYVNLARPGQNAAGDSKEAVRARSRFLNGEYYSTAADALCRLLTEALGEAKGLLVDAGCGEGYYTDRLEAVGFSVIGIDLSKFAVDAAAKRARRHDRGRSFYAVGSVFSLPIADGAADAVVNVFAPCAEKEYARVLRDGGLLAVVHAGPKHLMGLKRALYDTPRENDARADLPSEMALVREERVTEVIQVDGQEAIQSLFAMTPYYWKTSQADGEKLCRLSTLQTEVDMLISLYQKREKETI